MNKGIQLFTLVFILSFYSCKKNTISSSKDEKLLSEIVKNDIDFKYFSSRPKVKFDDGKMNMSSATNIKIEKGNQVWISVMPFLGIEAIRAKMTTDSVFTLNRLQREFTVSSFLFLNQQFGVNIDYNILEAIIMGDMPFKDLKKVKLLDNKNSYLLSQIINGFEVSVTIDKTIKRMKNIVIADKKGNKLEAFYSNFALLNNQQFANTITIKIEQPNKAPINATLNHKKVKISAERLKMPFRIPSSYVEKTYAK